MKATKTAQKRTDAALEAFNRYYTDAWGEERWHSLLLALSQPTRYCALVNGFATQSDVLNLLADESDQSTFKFKLPSVQNGLSGEEFNYPVVLQSSLRQSFPVPSQVPSGGTGKTVLSHWNMDLASALAASVLEVRPGERVLDLCAAPGGKSIVLAQMLWPELYASSVAIPESISDTSRTCLHSNESDHARHKRLFANMQAYLPSQPFADKAVKIIRIDAAEKSAVHELPFGAEGYDKVLLDAPCSSERHILQAHARAAAAGNVADEMANWKSSHTKTLAKTQAVLLMTALKAAKLGGKVLYATCSISHEENDDIIERTIEAVKRERKKTGSAQQSAWKVKIDTPFGNNTSGKDMLESMTQTTKYGRIVLPDHPAAGRWGPLYFCLIEKVPYRDKVGTSSKPPHDQELPAGLIQDLGTI